MCKIALLAAPLLVCSMVVAAPAMAKTTLTKVHTPKVLHPKKNPLTLYPVHTTVGSVTGTVKTTATKTSVTVTDASGTDYTVDLTHAHVIGTDSKKASIAALTAGTSVRVTGKIAKNSTGIAAKTVRILNAQ